MEAMLDKSCRPPKKISKIPVMQMGGCATFGERTIVQTPVHENRSGESECWIWSTTFKKHSEDEILACIRMRPGMDLKIQKNDDDVRGVKFFDPDGNFLEFAPFLKDGTGLEYDRQYEHITIDPPENDMEAQLVLVS